MSRGKNYYRSAPKPKKVIHHFYPPKVIAKAALNYISATGLSPAATVKLAADLRREEHFVRSGQTSTPILQ